MHQRLGVTTDDVAVSLAVRQELGPASEPAVIAEFLDRVGASIDERVDARVAAQRTRTGRGPSSVLLPLVSLGVGIPTTAIAAEQGVGALIVAWGGIAAVNLADALRR